MPRIDLALGFRAEDYVTAHLTRSLRRTSANGMAVEGFGHVQRSKRNSTRCSSLGSASVCASAASATLAQIASAAAIRSEIGSRKFSLIAGLAMAVRYRRGLIQITIAPGAQARGPLARVGCNDGMDSSPDTRRIVARTCESGHAVLHPQEEARIPPQPPSRFVSPRRSSKLPSPRGRCTARAAAEPAYARPSYLAWAELLRRTFAVDVLACRGAGPAARQAAQDVAPEVAEEGQRGTAPSHAVRSPERRCRSTVSSRRSAAGCARRHATIGRNEPRAALLDRLARTPRA